MFRAQTLFVVGAGASAEAGLVTGIGLKPKIASCLDLRFEGGYRRISGSEEIYQAFRIYQSKGGMRDINPLIGASRVIRDAMPRAISIDNFLDAHRNDKKIELCGKLAIAETILKEERGSGLFVRDNNGGTINHRRMGNTWYDYFFQFLTENVSKDDVTNLFENISFITFNYDRCIEQFLFHGLKKYYDLTDDEAAKSMQGLVVIHPYGTVGHLPWKGSSGIGFGEEADGTTLLKVSSQLKTFTEQASDQEALIRIRRLVERAEAIVFLGFAFHKLNMNILSVDANSQPKSIFATAFGISDSDCVEIGNRIFHMIGKQLPRPNFRIRNDLTCANIFKEYRMTLSQ